MTFNDFRNTKGYEKFMLWSSVFGFSSVAGFIYQFFTGMNISMLVIINFTTIYFGRCVVEDIKNGDWRLK